jgi:hypothetical protein
VVQLHKDWTHKKIGEPSIIVISSGISMKRVYAWTLKAAFSKLKFKIWTVGSYFIPQQGMPWDFTTCAMKSQKFWAAEK